MESKRALPSLQAISKEETHDFVLTQEEARLVMKGLCLLQNIQRELNGETQPASSFVPGQKEAAQLELQKLGRIINKFYW